jgi:CRISPR-associated protein Csb2
MTKHLCISVRFIDPSDHPSFHGRSDGGAPEWPPSPLRLFQALVAASAARFGDSARFRDYAAPAFEWLAGLHPPTVVAPEGVTGIPFRTAVPNNDMDVVAQDWARRLEPHKQPASLKTLKTVWPTYIVGGGEFPAVHYLWDVEDMDQAGFERHKAALFAAAGDLFALGWGTDMAIGHGQILTSAEACNLKGQRWEPVGNAAVTRLRVPTPGTFAALVTRHGSFLSRLGEKGFVPVPPLTAFAVVGYRRPTDTSSRPFVAFELRTPDFERFRPFDPSRHTCAVAGMVRNALAELARDMQPFGLATDKDLQTFINTFIHGHTPDGKRPAQGPDADRRFAYLPLPSLEHRGDAGVVVTAIRRVLVVGPPGRDREVAWARVLSGRELTPLNTRTPLAALRILEKPAAALRRGPNLGRYVGEATVWSTVTPLVLPGHDEAAPEIIARRVRLAPDQAARQRVQEKAVERTKRLLRLAFEQAGLPRELVAEAKLEWQSVGFRAGVDLVNRYVVPEPLNQLPRYHVRVRWPVPVRGPLAAGAGRYRGLGVFAAEKDG